MDYDKGTVQPMNGNITVVTDKSGLTVICGSGDERVLKDWEWFEKRICPDNWK